MPNNDIRPDLVRSLLQSCYVIEASRAALLFEWGGEFAVDAEAAQRRTDRLRDLLLERSLHTYDEIVPEHTAWMRSLCGASPADVPLGAALLNRLGTWNDVFATPFLGEEAETFKALGQTEVRFPVPPRDIQRSEVYLELYAERHAYLADSELPRGPRFAILTDVHIGAPGTDETAQAAVEDLNEIKPDFVLVPGDITEDGEPEQFAQAKDIFDKLDAPYHAVLGNHDAVQRSTRLPVGNELFEKAFGMASGDSVLECGPLQVALVDSTDPTPSPFPDWDLARGGFREDAGGVDSGALRPGQARALAAALDPGRPALVVLHHELQPFPGFPPIKFAMREEDSSALLQALSGHQLLGVIAGHTHRSAVLRVGDGSVAQVEVPSLKDWPFCYTVVGVDAEGGARVCVRQISHRDLVWKRSARLSPIYLNYVLSHLAHLSYCLGPSGVG